MKFKLLIIMSFIFKYNSYCQNRSSVILDTTFKIKITEFNKKDTFKILYKTETITIGTTNKIIREYCNKYRRFLGRKSTLDSILNFENMTDVSSYFKENTILINTIYNGDCFILNQNAFVNKVYCCMIFTKAIHNFVLIIDTNLKYEFNKSIIYSFVPVLE